MSSASKTRGNGEGVQEFGKNRCVCVTYPAVCQVILLLFESLKYSLNDPKNRQERDIRLLSFESGLLLEGPFRLHS